MNERHTENLLIISAEAAEFADDLGFSEPPASRFPAASSTPTSHGTGASPLVHWSAMAAAAALILGVSVWFAVIRQPAAIPTLPLAPILAKSESTTTTPSVRDDPNVNIVVALFRDNDKPSDECPACWCVTQWHADWGTGRDITKVQGDELLAASKDRKCVARPQQMIVVGLSGPASAMPASADLARQLALCLVEQQDDSSPQILSAAGDKPAAMQASCLPIGVDYRLATWTR